MESLRWESRSVAEARKKETVSSSCGSPKEGGWLFPIIFQNYPVFLYSHSFSLCVPSLNIC